MALPAVDADARGVEEVLQGDRDAVQRPRGVFRAGDRGLWRPSRVGERLFARDGDEGVQCRIQPLDAGQARRW